MLRKFLRHIVISVGLAQNFEKYSTVDGQFGFRISISFFIFFEEEMLERMISLSLCPKGILFFFYVSSKYVVVVVDWFDVKIKEMRKYLHTFFLHEVCRFFTSNFNSETLKNFFYLISNFSNSKYLR